MTSNQNAAKANEISAEKIAEEKRANIAQEKERARSNRAQEALTERGQNYKLAGDSLKSIGGVGSSLIKAINDPSWYNKDPQLVKDVASFAFGAPLGSTDENKATFMELNSSTEILHTDANRIPGVMGIRVSPAIPNAQLMRVIGDKYYAFVRHANSGSRNYEANDLMMYLLASTEAYAQLAHAAKLYSLLKTYKRENWYYSRSYFLAMGYSTAFFDDCLNNLNSFRARLNVCIRRINSFYIPNVFPLFARRVWLMTNIFKDHEVKRSSEYVFCPNHILLYTETSSNLRLDATAIDFSSFNNYMLQLENMITRLYSSEDLGIMSGDILKAYKDSGIHYMEEIPEDFHIESLYSKEVLSQINSATVVGPANLAYAGIFTQGAGGTAGIVMGNYSDSSSNNGYRVNPIINKTPIVALNSANATKIYEPDSNGLITEDTTIMEISDNVINMYKDDVTPDDVMVASRLQATTKVTKTTIGSTTPLVTVLYCGDVIVNTIRPVLINMINGVPVPIAQAGDLYDGMIATTKGSTTSTYLDPNTRLFDIIKYLPAFDWAPRIRCVYGGNTHYLDSSAQQPTPIISQPRIVYDNFDFANYMLISELNLSKLHQVAFMSLFDV